MIKIIQAKTEASTMALVAKSIDYSRGHLSRLANNDKETEDSIAVEAILLKKYKSVLQNVTLSDASEFSPGQLFAMFLEVSKAQTAILDRIEDKMAQETTQAIIQEKVKKLDEKAKEIGTNLIRTLAVVESARIVQDRSQIELLDHLRKLKAGKDLPSQDEGTRSRRKNADGQKRGKSPA